MTSSTAADSGSRPPLDTRHDRLWLLALLFLCVLGSLLRHTGIAFALPHSMESDGGVIVRQVALLEEGSDDPWREDSWSYYPHLVARCTALFTRAEPLPAKSASLEEHLHAASAPHMRVRGTVAVLSLLILPATWFLARRALSNRGTFFATLLVTFSQLDLCFSQEARAHAPAAAFAALTVVACLRLRERPGVSSYLLAGLAAALAIGTLQSGIAVLFPLAAAHFLRERDTSPRGVSLLASIAGALALIALAVIVLYPFTFTSKPTADTPEFYVRPDGNVQFFGHTLFLDQFDGKGFAHVWGTLVSFEPVLLALALCGVVLWLVRGIESSTSRFPRGLLVALAYVVPYLVVIGLYERTYERFVLQLLPFLAFAAGWLVEELARTRPTFTRVLRLAVLVFVTLAANALIRLRHAPDTGTRAAEWITANVAPNESVALLPYADVPLVRTDAALDDAQGLGDTPKLQVLSPWMNYQCRRRALLPAAPRFDLRTPRLARKHDRDLAAADPIEYFRAQGSRWVVVPVAAAYSGWEILAHVHAALRERAKLAVSIPKSSDESPNGELPLDVGDSSAWWRRNWTWSLLSGHATIGDVLEIYRVD